MKIFFKIAILTICILLILIGVGGVILTSLDYAGIFNDYVGHIKLTTVEFVISLVILLTLLEVNIFGVCYISTAGKIANVKSRK